MVLLQNGIAPRTFEATPIDNPDMGRIALGPHHHLIGAGVGGPSEFHVYRDSNCWGYFRLVAMEKFPHSPTKLRPYLEEDPTRGLML